MSYARLELSDGVKTVSLLANLNGFNLIDYNHQFADVKNNGVWLDNPLQDGRRLAVRKEGNIIDTLTLTITGDTQGDLADAINDLYRLLDQGVKYWLSPALQVQAGSSANPIRPVHLISQTIGENAPRYAIILDYRIQEWGDPFHGPMTSNPPSNPEFTLVLEHSVWMAGPMGTGECLDLDQDTRTPTTTSTVQVAIANTADDAEYSPSLSTINAAASYMRAGNDGGNRYGVALRFQNITVPQGTVPGNVTLRLPLTPEWDGRSFKLQIWGELATNAAAFSTYANLAARTRTTATLEVTQVDMGGPYAFWIENLEGVLTEIFAQGGWVSGNSLVLFVEDDGSAAGGFLSVDSFDTESPAAELVIQLSTLNGDKPAERCSVDQPMPVANARIYNWVGGFGYYDAAPAGYTDKNGLAGPWSLLPAVPAVGDAVVFALRGPSGAIAMNLQTAGSGFAGVWEYYTSGSVWASLTVKDETAGFTLTGPKGIYFDPPADWDDGNLMLSAYYHIRFRLTSVPGAAVVPVQAAAWRPYVVNRNYVEVETDPLTRALDVLGRLELNPVSGATNQTNLTVDEVWMGIRSVSRGEDFSANLPCNNIANPPGVAFSHEGAPAGMSSISYTATGGNHASHASWQVNGIAYLNSNVLGALKRAEFLITSPYVKQYQGTFRVFLRRYRVANSEGARWRLVISTGAADTSQTYITPWVQDTDNPQFDVLDFGNIRMPPGFPVGSDLDIPQLYIRIEAEILSGTVQVYLSDLSLIPVDEWAARVWQRVDAASPSFTAGVSGNIFRIDSIQAERPVNFVVMKAGQYLYTPLYMTNGRLTFQEKRNVRIWFLFGTYVSGNTGYRRRWHPAQVLSVAARFNARYMTLRG